MERSTILFDGVCNLCNASVRFVLRRDPQARFQFASLQSDAGQQLLWDHGLDSSLSTIVLIEGGQAYQRSAAALRICRRLRAPWPLLYACILIPPFLRDGLYNVVARNRYRWFGKQSACSLLDDPHRDRFLDAPETPAP